MEQFILDPVNLALHTATTQQLFINMPDKYICIWVCAVPVRVHRIHPVKQIKKPSAIEHPF